MQQYTAVLSEVQKTKKKYIYNKMNLIRQEKDTLKTVITETANVINKRIL